MTYLASRRRIRGILTEGSSPMDRIVRVYDRLTGEPLVSGRSDPVTGHFDLQLGRASPNTMQLLAFDDALDTVDFNALIKDHQAYALVPNSDLTTGSWAAPSTIEDPAGTGEDITLIKLASGKLMALQRDKIWVYNGSWTPGDLTLDGGTVVHGSTIVQDSSGTLHVLLCATASGYSNMSLFAIQSADEGAIWSNLSVVRPGVSPSDRVYDQVRAVIADNGDLVAAFTETGGLRIAYTADTIAWSAPVIAANGTTTYVGDTTTGLEMLKHSSGDIYIACNSAPNGTHESAVLYKSITHGVSWSPMADIYLDSTHDSFSIGGMSEAGEGYLVVGHNQVLAGGTDPSAEYSVYFPATDSWEHFSISTPATGVTYGYINPATMGNYLVFVVNKQTSGVGSLDSYTWDIYDRTTAPVVVAIADSAGTDYQGSSGMVVTAVDTLLMVMNTLSPALYSWEYTLDP